MKKTFFIVSFLFVGLFVKAQTGIGTTTPVNKFEVVATTADPASSGSSANGNLRLGASASSHVLDFGLSSSSNYAWLQARLKSNYGTNYSLVLNPIGGNVGIGNTSPSSTLTVGNAAGTIGGEILLNPTTTQHEGGQIVLKRSLVGSTVDWTIDQYGTTSANARFRIFNGASETNGITILENGKIGMGLADPTTLLHLQNNNSMGSGDPGNTTVPSLYINNTNSASTTAHSILTIRTNNSGGGNPYLSFDINSVKGYSMGIDNADGDKFKFHNNWSFNNSNTPILTITSENRVGIGTTSPEVPLHVASSASQFVVAYGFLSPGGTGTGTYNQTISYSIQADGRIRSNEFNAISDIRIKKNIVPLKSNVQLLELNNLRVVNYSYIDQLANGNSIKTGFIAQEVEKVNDRFVNKSTEFIPSVFALVKSALVENEVLKIITEKPHGFVKGDVVKFFAEGKKEVIKTIDEVESANEFIVSSWKESTNNLFIYGKKITDFRAIDFDQITALSVGAIQELSKQIDSLKLENEKFKKKQSDFEARLLKLESKLN
jgi:hypothetical protein